jgi:hypothetical protein
MKDLLYQSYVRKGRLQQAMMVRRYFVEEDPGKVTSITAAIPGAASQTGNG